MSPHGRLVGDVAVVTGGGSGIGSAIVDLFAAEGAAVAVLDLDETSAQDTAERARAAGGRAVGISFDVAGPVAYDDIAERVESEFGAPLSVWINNAGIWEESPLIARPLEVWQRILAVDLTGCYLGAACAARAFIRTGTKGRIVNAASTSSFSAMPENVAYDAAKGGVLQLTRSLAVELGPHGIRVNCVAPGFVSTPATVIDGIWTCETDEFKRTWLDTNRIPLGRVARAEDIAPVYLFLASDDSRYVSGTMIVADAGWTAGNF